MVVDEVTVAFTTLGPDPGVASLVLSVTVKLGSEVPKKGHIRSLKITFSLLRIGFVLQNFL